VTSLIISFLPLIAAPLLCWLCTKTATLAQLMDGFLFVAIGGLIVSGVLPQAWLNGGWPVVLFLLLGLLLPVLSERILHHVGEVHRVALILGISGLLLHAITDGAALSQGSGVPIGEGEHLGGDLLSMSVLLHRLPIGLTIWWLVYPQFGLWAASSVLGVIGLGTLLGFAFAPGIMEPLSTEGMAYFQAFVAGSLVHVLYHRPHAGGADHAHDHHHYDSNLGSGQARLWPEGLGNVLGGALVIFLASHHDHSGEWAWLEAMEHTLLALALVSAPVLLLAYIVASLVGAFIPRDERLLAWLNCEGSSRQQLRGLVAGIFQPARNDSALQPRPLVARIGTPAGVALFTASALLSVEALFLSVPLLGLEYTLLRCAAILLFSWLVGRIVWRLGSAGSARDNASGMKPELRRADRRRWCAIALQGFRDSMMERIDHSAPWVVLGLLSAAIAQPMLQDGLLQNFSSLWAVLFFAVLGLPVYICAAGATPLMAVLVAATISPGAALAFLITGPAIHLRLFTALAELRGKKTAVSYVFIVFFFALGAGYLINALLPDYQPPAWQQAAKGDTWWQLIPLVVVGALYLYSLLRGGARAFVMRLFTPAGSSHSHHHH
jgi:uncharacterized membrane protein YraQ (UPF0718 family)